MQQKINLVVLFGPPGSGKTTQAFLLQETLGYHYISWGQISREIMQTGGEYPHLQPMLLEALAKGQKLREGVIQGVLQGEISRILKNSPDIKGIVIDGYPRYLREAKELLEIIHRTNLHF